MWRSPLLLKFAEAQGGGVLLVVSRRMCFDIGERGCVVSKCSRRAVYLICIHRRCGVSYQDLVHLSAKVSDACWFV